MLSKSLDLGGLQVGGPRTKQHPARFRVANNVYQTSKKYMVPRRGNTEHVRETVIEESAEVVSVQSYAEGLFPGEIAFFKTSGGLKLYRNDFDMFLPGWNLLPGPPTPVAFAPDDDGELDNGGPQYLEKLGCLFFTSPSALFKYDGTQFYRAGVPLPFVSCAEYASGGTTFVRSIQHHIDFQGNIVNSGYVEFPVTPVGGNITLAIDKNHPDMLGSLNVSPRYRGQEKLTLDFDSHYFVSTSKAGLVFTTGGNHNVTDGAYVLVSATKILAANNGTGKDMYALALRVFSQTATTVTLTLQSAKYLDGAGEWQHTQSLDTSDAFWAGITFGTNYWQSIWTSNASTGNYVFKKLIPSLYFSTTAQNSSVNVSAPTTPDSAGAASTAFNLAGNMGDIYDVTTVKTLFPTAPSSNFPLSFSTYGDLGVIAVPGEEAIPFSDTSLGGSFEMTNGLANIVVGEGDDGPIQTVCGTSDFMLVSRQFKNYYVSGNLPTANYKVSEIPETNLGAYSNESSINIGDKVLFFNKKGVWAVSGGGACMEVSEQVSGLFDDFTQSYSFSEESFFNIDNFQTFAGLYDENESVSGKWVRLRFDPTRNLLLFVKKTQILVLNMGNGEFYTWSDMLPTGDVSDITFINGKYFVSANNTGGRRVFKEANDYTYMTTKKPRLDNTWFSAGEPSLEKKLNQVKIWGHIPQGGTVDISHTLDWDDSSSVIDGAYTADQAFSHKKRLVPANFLAVSVSMRFDKPFQIEGIEIEFSMLQAGMKR